MNSIRRRAHWGGQESGAPDLPSSARFLVVAVIDGIPRHDPQSGLCTRQDRRLARMAQNLETDRADAALMNSILALGKVLPPPRCDHIAIPIFSLVALGTCVIDPPITAKSPLDRRRALPARVAGARYCCAHHDRARKCRDQSICRPAARRPGRQGHNPPYHEIFLAHNHCQIL